jgi:threonine dehydrogenase-like Zn-dependent dehydrogenase
MRATIMYRAGDVRVENVPDATLKQPTDALIRITRSCICGSDLWPYTICHQLRADAGWDTKPLLSSKPWAPTCAR